MEDKLIREPILVDDMDHAKLFHQKFNWVIYESADKQRYYVTHQNGAIHLTFPASDVSLNVQFMSYNGLSTMRVDLEKMELPLDIDVRISRMTIKPCSKCTGCTNTDAKRMKTQ